MKEAQVCVTEAFRFNQIETLGYRSLNKNHKQPEVFNANVQEMIESINTFTSV